MTNPPLIVGFSWSWKTRFFGPGQEIFEKQSAKNSQKSIAAIQRRINSECDSEESLHQKRKFLV